MPHILFVCTANLYRSPLAAAFFSRKLQSDGSSQSWVVESAGTWTVPGRTVPANLLTASRMMGIDLKRHRTQQVDPDLLARVDLIVVMEKGHREALRVEFPSVRKKVYLLSELADQLEYDIADPVHNGLSANETLLQMSGLIDRAYARLCHLTRAREIT